MKQIGVFGASGMLGAYVEAYFKQQGFEVVAFSRLDVVCDLEDLKRRLAVWLHSPSWIINCVGVINTQIALQGIAETIRINSLFPHILSKAATESGHTLLHISTDCVFSGNQGNYSEASLHDATDIYGRSKSLGEPVDCRVLRTSIIGEEKNYKRSLIEWAKSQAGKDVKGYTNHSWNGVTCLQFAKIAQFLMNSKIDWRGVRHLFSPTAVSKYELLMLINQVFDLNLKISVFETESPCYRTLSTIHSEINNAFNIPELRDQLCELRKFTWS